MAKVGSLTSEQLHFFDSNGYIVLKDFVSSDETDAMMKRMEQLLDDFDYSTSSIFSTKNQQRKTDDYFYESAEKVSYFFEEKAFDDDGNLKQPKQLSINKVGHALHEKDPIFRTVSSSEKVSSLLRSLHYKRPVIIQSMYIFKQPGIGGEVVPHQDNSFLYTEPQTCTGLWLALEDATTINGCLWAIPGSHKKGLVRRFIRDENSVHFDQPSPSYDQNDFVPLEVKTGSLVVLHGDLIHQSFENQSSKSRHAYSWHVVYTDGCTWASWNWIDEKCSLRHFMYLDQRLLFRSSLAVLWQHLALCHMLCFLLSLKKTMTQLQITSCSINFFAIKFHLFAVWILIL